MTTISKEEVLKIAHISQLRLDENEVEPLIKHMQSLLSYAECIQHVVVDEDQYASTKNINKMRDDIILNTDSQALINAAPEHEHNYFVVPKVIESK